MTLIVHGLAIITLEQLVICLMLLLNVNILRSFDCLLIAVILPHVSCVFYLCVECLSLPYYNFDLNRYVISSTVFTLVV